jgi:hypothetical protein
VIFLFYSFSLSYARLVVRTWRNLAPLIRSIYFWSVSIALTCVATCVHSVRRTERFIIDLPDQVPRSLLYLLLQSKQCNSKLLTSRGELFMLLFCYFCSSVGALRIKHNFCSICYSLTLTLYFFCSFYILLSK